MEFWGHGGVAHFGISEGKGGLKHGSRPWLGMDIFWNCPMSNEKDRSEVNGVQIMIYSLVKIEFLLDL